VNLHPKDASIGQKSIWYSSVVLIEQEDAQLINSNDTVTFVNWGNLKIVDVEKENGVVKQIRAKLDLDNKDYKKTLKVTWLADVDHDKNIEVKAYYYDHVISKPILEKTDEWTDFINKDSLVCVCKILRSYWIFRKLSRLLASQS
jgi:bifunctional glutamyl/prolyl-tRNA synthetase